MVTNRRARPTIRCLTEDPGSELPGLHEAGALDALVDGVGGAVRVSASGPRAARERRGDGLHV